MLLPVLLGLVLAVPALSPEFVQSANGAPLVLASEPLALTPDQQAQLATIQTQAEAAARQILTPDQQSQWTSLWENSQHLHLTAAQKSEMTALRLRVLGQMHRLLTPAQRQQWQAQLGG
ncbi:MAG: hypothetical protein Q6J18_07325 [Gloeomargarita sp. DG02_3_bins_56]